MEKKTTKKPKHPQFPSSEMAHEKLKHKIRRAENLNKAKFKKQDTRRKILVGAYFLDQTEKIGELAALKKQMLGFLKRPSDKALFEEG
jgi:large subunit ribosomal protein L7/L12